MVACEKGRQNGSHQRDYNVTVNWYKSTKTFQIQGINEQMVKQHRDELIWTSNLNCSQVNTGGKDTSLVEFDSGLTKGDSATIVASSSNEGKENGSHYISDSKYDPVGTENQTTPYPLELNQRPNVMT